MKGKTMNQDKIVLCQSKITMGVKWKTELKEDLRKLEGKKWNFVTKIFAFYWLMITCCLFRAIKFCQLEIQCNFPVYLIRCIKYKLILLWCTLLSEIFAVLQGFLKINPVISFMINIETPSIHKNCLPLWFGFLCYLIYFCWRTFIHLFSSVILQ